MQASVLLRSSILCAALGAALSAQAINVNLVSKGSFTPTSATSVHVVEKVLAQDPSSLPMLTGLAYDVNSLGIGSGKYSNAGGDSLSFSFAFSPAPSFSGASGTVSAAGMWTYTGGTGAFAPYVAGGGTLAGTYDLATGNTSMTTFSGAIQAVPEPASCAALGLGALGLLRRRRKA